MHTEKPSVGDGDLPDQARGIYETQAIASAGHCVLHAGTQLRFRGFKSLRGPPKTLDTGCSLLTCISHGVTFYFMKRRGRRESEQPNPEFCATPTPDVVFPKTLPTKTLRIVFPV